MQCENYSFLQKFRESNVFIKEIILLVTNPEGKNKIIAPQEIILAHVASLASWSGCHF